MKLNNLTLIYTSFVLLCSLLIPVKTIAQVTSDNNLSTTVTSPDGQNFIINDGDRTGNNLFHSFKNFSIPNGGSASFANAPDIANIFSRVTGGVDPISGLVELSDDSINAENLLAQDLCKIENGKIAKGSSFIITGRGGLAPTSADSIDNRDVVGWANRTDIELSNNGLVGVRQRESKDTSAIVEGEIQQSQSWVTTADGSVWLVANAPKSNSPSSGIDHPNCGNQEKT